MTDQDPASTVREHLDAFSARDLPRMLATLSPTAHFVSGTTTVPPAEFAEFFGWAMTHLAPTMRIDTLLVDGHRAACEFTESLHRNGQQQHLRRAAFYEVSGGVITRAKVYDERE